MDDLKAFKVPALILSGGEPLLRPDFFDIAARSKELGFYTALSSNGTLIDEPMCRRIANADFHYVGVSLDGLGKTHDKFRRMDGAFDLSLAGIRLCRDAGMKVGVRFTLTQDNFADLPGLLQLVEDEGVDRFYFSHLNYAGRGNKNRKDARPASNDAGGDGSAVRHLLALSGKRLAEGIHHRQQRRRWRLSAALGAREVSGKSSTHRSQVAPVGRQCLGRERGEHRQPRQCASRHDVAAPHARQRARAAVLGDLAGCVRSSSWPG